MNGYVWLIGAILAEVLATSMLKASDGFSQFWPSLVTMAGYGFSFWCLSHAIKTVPLGVAYAVWSGVGIVLLAIIGWFAYGQKLDAGALAGIGLIMAGVLVINIFSGAAK